MKKLYFKISSAVLLAIIVLFFTPSCKSGSDSGSKNSYVSSGDVLTDILKSYRDGGMTSWWQIAAVYNANENPLDYKGFDDVLTSLEGDTNIKMASYVIVVDIAAVIGADPGYYEKYEEYKAKLKNLLENPAAGVSLNDYIFGYYALKCSGMSFNQTPLTNYLLDAPKSDGGFALSGDVGDVDMTAIAVPVLKLLALNQNIDVKTNLDNAVKFLENSVSPDGTFLSIIANQAENSNSTSVALSALVCYYGDDGSSNDTIKKIRSGLDIFKVKDDAGYSYLKGGSNNMLATAQAAVALGDVKNKTSVWEKLYNDSLTAFTEE